MIKKLNENKPKKGEKHKVMCDKIKALKVKYQDQDKILDNDTFVMYLFLVCVKMQNSESMQAQVEAEVNDTDITCKISIRCLNITLIFESDSKRVTQVGESKVALTNIEFKGKCHTYEKYGHKQNKCPEKNKTKEGKENEKFSGRHHH